MGTCPTCGEALTGDSAYCSTCGTRLPDGDERAEEGSAAGTPPGFPSPSTPPAPPPQGDSMPWYEGEDARLERTSPPYRAIAIGALVVVALLALGLVVLGGGDDEPGSVGGGTTTSTLLPLSTSPVLTDEEFVIDTLAADDGTSPLAGSEENACFFQSLVAAMGGSVALREAGITPERLAEPFALRGEVVPPAAVDTFLATAATCGLDLVEVLFVRSINFEAGPDVAACVGAGLADRAPFNRLIAAFFLDPNRSDIRFSPPPEIAQQLSDLLAACQ